jgi:hypothetical protein
MEGTYPPSPGRRKIIPKEPVPTTKVPCCPQCQGQLMQILTWHRNKAPPFDIRRATPIHAWRAPHPKPSQTSPKIKSAAARRTTVISYQVRRKSYQKITLTSHHPSIGSPLRVGLLIFQPSLGSCPCRVAVFETQERRGIKRKSHRAKIARFSNIWGLTRSSVQQRIN